VLETGEIELEKRWLCSAKVSTVWVHRTVRWCTRQCPVRQAGSGELAALGKRLTTYGYKSPDCPVCTGQCPVSQRSAARSAQDTWSSQRSEGGTGLSGAPTALRRQRSASPNKERGPHRTVSGGAPDCPVVHRTVSGAPGWLRRTCCSREKINDVRL
jgi:hypothetical protein